MLGTLRKFFAFCPSAYRTKFYQSLGLGVLMAACRSLRIPAIAVMLSGVVEGNVTTFHIVCSAALAFVGMVGEGLLRSRSTTLQTQAGYGAATDARIRIAEHMRYLPMGYFNDHSLGQVASVTTNTMENLQGVATRVVMLVSEGILNTALIALFLLAFDWRIGLILVAGCVVFFLVNGVMQARSAALSLQKIASDEALVGQVLEYVQGMHEVKSFRMVGTRSQRLNAAIEKNAELNTTMELTLVPYLAAQSMVTKLTGAAMAAASVWFYLGGSMDLLVCMVMIVCSFLIYGSLDTAGTYSGLLRIVDVCVQRASDILATDTMDTTGQDITPASLDIDFEDVQFAYGQRSVINGVTAHIPQGKTTALVGPSGGGKTTLANLASRFWDVDAGRVLLGGRDVREYSMDALMRNFSFVFQRVYLFKDTVANNIRFGNPDASLEEVQAAAKAACCHDFIMALPQGYDTVIGEGGANLSGGEAQRISIARAIMKDAPIVVLDEATANVDPENEHDLVEAIARLTQGKTVLMIAHRLKTVRTADQILVVDEGRIVQRGTHEELLEQEGIYKRFVEARQKAASWQL